MAPEAPQPADMCYKCGCLRNMAFSDLYLLQILDAEQAMMSSPIAIAGMTAPKKLPNSSRGFDIKLKGATNRGVGALS